MTQPPPKGPKPGALLEAVWLVDIGAVRRLLAEGADVNEKDAFGNNVLNRAAGYGLLEITQLLIDNGADVNSRNLYGETALLRVAGSYIKNRDAMLRLLLDNGVDVDIKNNLGETALTLAIQRAHPPHTIDMLKNAAATRKQRTEEFAKAAETKKRAPLVERQRRLVELSKNQPKRGPKPPEAA